MDNNDNYFPVSRKLCKSYYKYDDDKIYNENLEYKKILNKVLQTSISNISEYLNLLFLFSNILYDINGHYKSEFIYKISTLKYDSSKYCVKNIIMEI